MTTQSVTQRSTSPLMRDLFGNDIDMILDDYNNRIVGLTERHLLFKDILSECVNRTGFLLPYMFVEYGYYSVKGEFMPLRLKELVMSFGLVALAICVEDDAADERDDLVITIKRISVAEFLQNEAYSILIKNAHQEETSIVLSGIQDLLDIVAQYQHLDAVNVVTFPQQGFDKSKYLEGTYKTGGPITVGLQLGMELAQERQNPENTFLEELGRCFGTVLQLLDDVLDLEDDLVNYKGIITLPMFLRKNNLLFWEVFDLVDSSLNKSLGLSSNFRYDEKIIRVINGFGTARDKVMERPIESVERVPVAGVS